jgi:hypothetical protein
MRDNLLEQPVYRVLVVGVYLADKENLASRISQELAASVNWRVEQRWISLGKSKPHPHIAPFTVETVDMLAPKFSLVNRLLGHVDLHAFEYIIVTDDDIQLPIGFVDRYLALVSRYDLALAQPARTHDSYTDHYFVKQLHGINARWTRFVEIGPLFSLHSSTFNHFLPFDETSPMGWGNDFVWPTMIENKGLKMGIVDAVPVTHNMRKPAVFYDHATSTKHMAKYLAERPHLSKEEAFFIMESYVE